MIKQTSTERKRGQIAACSEEESNDSWIYGHDLTAEEIDWSFQIEMFSNQPKTIKFRTFEEMYAWFLREGVPKGEIYIEEEYSRWVIMDEKRVLWDGTQGKQGSFKTTHIYLES